MCIRDSSGISLLRVKPFAFMLGAGIAGLAAALSAGIFSYVDPGQSEFLISAIVLAMVVVGGSRRMSGVILGALLVASIDQIILPLLGDWWAIATGGSGLQIATLNYLAFGLVLYAVSYTHLDVYKRQGLNNLLRLSLRYNLDTHGKPV